MPFPFECFRLLHAATLELTEYAEASRKTSRPITMLPSHGDVFYGQTENNQEEPCLIPSNS